MNVPKLRFSDFTDEYKKLKYGNCLKIKSGKDQKQVQCENGIYPILGTGGIIGTTNSYLYNKPSVLIGRKGTINKPQYMETPFWTVDTLFYSEIFDGYIPKYLYYSFQNVNWKKYDESTGVPSLSCSTIEKVDCYIPTVNEQIKVSNFLSLLDKKIELQSKKIEDLKLFKKGLLNVISKEITESKTIKEICEYKNGNSYEEYVCDEGNYNLISLNSVDINGNLKNDMKKIKLSNPDTLIKNDIVMVLSDVAHGDFLGVSALIDEDNKYVLNQRMGLLRIMDNSIPQFIVEMINNEQRKFKILGQGSSQLNLSKDDILNQKIKYPCIISQKKYATIFNNINTSLKLNKEKLIKLQELKKGLMQNMFV